MVRSRVREVLRETALKYSQTLTEAQLNDIPRTAFHIGLVRRSAGRHAVICELGGGGGLFSPACAALGMKVTIVGDADLLRGEVDFPTNQFDAVVSFDAICHLHTAPERFFLRLKTWLRPGGAFILSVPNGARRRTREPNVADLRNLAKHMELRRVRILGRNGLRSRRPPLLTAADYLLRLYPPLCADLYLIGHK